MLAHTGSVAFAPLELAPALLVALLYARRARTLAQTPRAVPGWRQASFHGGIALIAVTLVSPLAHLAEELFVAHMAEHLIMADLGALLVVLGLTGPVLAPVLRIRILDRLRVLTHPAVALPLWAVNLFAWHLPALYQEAVSDPFVHALEHGLFVSLGAAMWMPLFGPLPVPLWFGNLGRLLYVTAVRLSGAVLANVILWTSADMYPDYAPGRAVWDVTALGDQQAAGAVMMVEESILTICLFGWLFLRAAREGEERQELLDLAGARGFELTDARAARAVAAGRAGDLRKRIEEASSG